MLEQFAKSGVLTGKQIIDCKLIKGADERSYQPCSYDLRLGYGHYVSDETGKWKLVYLVSKENREKELSEFQKKNSIISGDAMYSGWELMKYSLSANEQDVLQIPPFGTAIIELLEIVDTATSLHNRSQVIVGRFDLKLSVIYKGLFSQQATQVEPGYCGHLYCFITSQSSEPVELKLGERIATIEFSFADSKNVKWVRGSIKKKYDGPFGFCSDNGIKDIRFFCLSERIPKECGLTPIYKKVTESFSNEIDTHLKKPETIESISKSVERNLNTKTSLLKAFFSLLAAIAAAFGGDYVLRVGKKIEAIADVLTDFLDELQNSAGETVDGEALSLELRALQAEGIVLRYVVWSLIVLFGISFLIFITKTLVSWWASFYEVRKHHLAAKIEFKRYKHENDIPKEKACNLNEKRAKKHSNTEK